MIDLVGSIHRPERMIVFNTILALILVSTFGLLSPVNAKQKPMEICEVAAQRAAQTSGVPVNILRAISRTETGRKFDGGFGPWPWTVNMEGKGVWFDSDDAARAYVYKHFKRGARSFDVGCFQINYRWHHQEFASLEEMFDPLAGAKYAAKFLKDLHAELGNWEAAAGAYHSRTPRHANRYKALFKQHYAKVQEMPAAPPSSTEAKRRVTDERNNRFPLLMARNGALSAGSLVKLESGGQSPGLLRSGNAIGLLP